MQKTRKFYSTKLGTLLLGNSYEALQSGALKRYEGKVNLIITSPPFPLNNKKKYGNLNGDEYKEWFLSLAPLFEKLLTKDGSVVLEIGNAWEPNRPVQSLLHLECLLGFVKNSQMRLIQEFICYNPSRLPSPAQWVTVNRIRTVDSYTHIWWMSKSDFPKANNENVLRPYSASMQSLLRTKKFNSGSRPSEHRISEKGFLKDNGGSIAHNLFELEAIDPNRDVRLPFNTLSFSNSSSNDLYLKKCRKHNILPHPARMHPGIVDFFLRFLTNEKDLVFDPFAGSNTTGSIAENLKRKWLCMEIDREFADQSTYRFDTPSLKKNLKIYL